MKKQTASSKEEIHLYPQLYNAVRDSLIRQLGQGFKWQDAIHNVATNFGIPETSVSHVYHDLMNS